MSTKITEIEGIGSEFQKKLITLELELSLNLCLAPTIKRVEPLLSRSFTPLFKGLVLIEYRPNQFFDTKTGLCIQRPVVLTMEQSQKFY